MYQGGQYLSFYSSSFLIARLIIKLTQDRLIGEKETIFNLGTQRSNRNWSYKVAKAGSFYTF